MDEVKRLLVTFTSLWPRPDLVMLASIVALVGLIALTEVILGGSVRRYVSRNARTDALHAAFYLVGFYGVLVSSPITRCLGWAVDAFVPFVPLDLLKNWPIALQAATYLVVGDLTKYWVHRWTHVNPWLWQFHKIHHSQDVMTPWTNFRSHFGDIALQTVAFYLLALLLGPQRGAWVALSILMFWHVLMLHTGRDWGFGWLGHAIVSPRFHSVHHSADPRHAGRNFGSTFTFWDHLFGTADTTSTAPAAFGLSGPRLPESFFRLLVWPFLALARGRPTG